MNKNIEPSFFFYDLETFGISAQVDRISQFAGVRTNANLEPIEDPIILYCKVAPDFLPDPLSCLVTGITPQVTLVKGIPENEFITAIHKEFSRPNTCVLGYNSLQFDDEFVRYSLYRNLIEPYSREYANGNSRWDIINLVRMTHDLRPSGIVWPKKEDGSNSFRLEDMTKANGISHENAHDAMSDVNATIEIAKLIQHQQPKLFHYLFNLRKKQSVMPFMDIHKKEPFLYTHPSLRNEYGNTSVIAPIAIDYKMRNKIYCCNLANDVDDLIHLPIEELRERYYYRPAENEERKYPRVNLFSVQMNKSPAISVLSALRQEDQTRLHIDLAKCMENHQKLMDHPEVSIKLLQLFSEDQPMQYEVVDTLDPDFMLYSGPFINDTDRMKLNQIRSLSPAEILNANITFEDSRLKEMVWRFVCRNYPETLSEKEAERWKSFCASRLLVPAGGRISDINFYFRKIKEKLDDKEISAKAKVVLTDLLNYGNEMRQNILGISSCEKM